jgi:hypothetical protein
MRNHVLTRVQGQPHLLDIWNVLRPCSSFLHQLPPVERVGWPRA